MIKLKRVMMSIARCIPALALLLGMSSVSQACIWWYHQPQVPEQMKR